MTLTFGSDHSYDRAGLIIVAAGLGFHLTALTLTQAPLARDRAAAAAAAGSPARSASSASRSCRSSAKSARPRSPTRRRRRC